MKTLSSYLAGQWAEGQGGGQTLVNPTTEEPLASASTSGLDMQGALTFARAHGSPALREL